MSGSQTNNRKNARGLYCALRNTEETIGPGCTLAVISVINLRASGSQSLVVYEPKAAWKFELAVDIEGRGEVRLAEKTTRAEKPT